jgi:hypothetical protein
VSKILAFLTAIAKPLIDLWNNILDPGKKKERMRLEIQCKLRSLEDLRCYCEQVIKASKNGSKKRRFERRLGECLAAISRLRHELETLK